MPSSLNRNEEARMPHSRPRLAVMLLAAGAAGLGLYACNSGNNGASDGGSGGGGAGGGGTGGIGGGGAGGTGGSGGAAANDGSVTQHHNSATRDGVFVQPSLTPDKAATLHRDSTFDGTVDG